VLDRYHRRIPISAVPIKPHHVYLEKLSGRTVSTGMTLKAMAPETEIILYLVKYLVHNYGPRPLPIHFGVVLAGANLEEAPEIRGGDPSLRH
jgi:hypothetical protein